MSKRIGLVEICPLCGFMHVVLAKDTDIPHIWCPRWRETIRLGGNNSETTDMR